ncbi:MAG TPA: biotin--[acetyl-CoA-carboxylase] ligase [Acidimicrobiales bacterium]|nr:biotin--[acetyl-CoA-carboxylase] ligase [Acidimicrobiales bacterium]
MGSPRGRFSDVRWFAELDSTNRLAADLARAGAPDGVVVGAGHQTAGRGRRGRSWDSRPGASLLVSVILRPAPPLVTLAAGVAAAEACEAVAGVEVGLKWPNDLLLDGVKLGGILSELVGDAAVVGLGLNLAWAPAGAAMLGRGADREVLLDAYLAGLAAPGDVLDRYRERCTTLGRRVRVELPAGAVEGVASGVDDHGRLLVEGRPIAAGDVVHLR